MRAVWSPPDTRGRGGARRREGVPELRPPFPRIEWVPSLNAALGADAMTLDDEALRNAARRIGVQKVETLSRPKVLDEMFQALVESKLVEPTFVVDYPGRAVAARQAEARQPGADGALRAVRARARDGERVQRAE